VSVTHKLVPEGLGCVSDLPEIVFACATIPAKEVLGVYIPYDSGKPVSCVVSRNQHLWTADLNNDGIPELAGVLDTFEGIASDTMARIIWYANVNGVWKLIDQAEELDCT
jgi:hypothetical protein